MVSLTISMPDEFKSEMKHFSWVNWSELGREESMKKEIFEEYIKTGKLSNDNEKFCEEIDWHPVDELEIREEYIEKLKKQIKKSPDKPMTLEEFDKWWDSL